MNGVRRFFAATNVVAQPLSTTPPPPPSQAFTNTQKSDLPPSPRLPPIQTSFIPASSGNYISSSALNGNGPAQPLEGDGPADPEKAPSVMSHSPSSRKPVNTDFKTFSSSPTIVSKPSYANSPSPVAVRSPTSATSSSSTHPAQMNGIHPSSPTLRPAEVIKQSNFPGENGRKYTPTLVDPRDDLLINLLASEAAVDSRGFQILSSDEVDDLKREQELLSLRLGAMKKKVALETKIRDAALNLQKLQTVKRLSKQTSEQADAATRKVEIATKELSRLLERTNDIDRKLLEHRAGVLSLSLRKLEATLSSDTSATDDNLSSTRSGMTSRGVSSRSSSVTSMSTRTKFDGAHLFAGHADSIKPGSTRKIAASPFKLAALGSKVQAAEAAAQAAEAKSDELQKEIQRLQVEKSEVDKNLTLDRQTAEETITKLERDMWDMERGVIDQGSERANWDRDTLEWERHRNEWEREREEWTLERRRWEAAREEWDRERQALEDEVASRSDNVALTERSEELQSRAAKADGLERMVSAKDDEIRRIRLDMDQQREDLQNRLATLENQKQEEIERMRQEFKTLEVDMLQVDAGRNILCDVVRSYKIPTSPSDTTIPSIASSLNSHIASLSTKVAQLNQEKAELEASRRKHEEVIRNGYEIRERLSQELEQARQEREEARREVRMLETRLKDIPNGGVQEMSNVIPSIALPAADANDAGSTEYTKLMAALRGLWSVLPSAAARAAKVGKSGTISDLDVRALKSLYDPKAGVVSSPVGGAFSIDEFVARVQALIADDRALIERLIRFAQAHDLLRNNAGRAQKLAQESNKGLEMYQIQVKALEERNANLTRKQLELLDEINSLQESIDMVTREKRELEAQAIDQSQVVQDLTDANIKLNAQILALAAEAATPSASKIKLEGQLAETQAKLMEAQQEIDRIRSSESMQRVTLLDELNSLQQENGKLRDQLRKK